MEESKLIEFGKKLITKGRSPREIRSALAIKTQNKNELNSVLKKVFENNQTKTHRNPKRVKMLIESNQVKLDLKYSILGLYRMAGALFIIGGITSFLSKEEVNQNSIFGYITIIQAVSLACIFFVVRQKNRADLLLVSVIVYFSIFLIELIGFGIPNDLFEAYNNHKMKLPPGMKFKANAGMARLIGFIFPFVYILLKLLLGWFILSAHLNYRKYSKLTMDVKEDLKTF